MNFQEILKHYPPSYQNNAREIIKDLLERYIAKPSYYIQKKLEGFGIGVNWSEGFGDDISRPEEFALLTKEQITNNEDHDDPAYYL